MGSFNISSSNKKLLLQKDNPQYIEVAQLAASCLSNKKLPDQVFSKQFKFYKLFGFDTFFDPAFQRELCSVLSNEEGFVYLLEPDSYKNDLPVFKFKTQEELEYVSNVDFDARSCVIRCVERAEEAEQPVNFDIRICVEDFLVLALGEWYLYASRQYETLILATDSRKVYDRICYYALDKVSEIRDNYKYIFTYDMMKEHFIDVIMGNYLDDA